MPEINGWKVFDPFPKIMISFVVRYIAGRHHFIVVSAEIIELCMVSVHKNVAVSNAAAQGQKGYTSHVFCLILVKHDSALFNSI